MASTTNNTDTTQAVQAISPTTTNAYNTYGASIGTKTNVFLGSVKVFIAGILMPCLGVSISSSFNSSPTANITVPADPRLFNVGEHDRVPVLVFAKETIAESPQYILLFEGYVAERQYLSVATQREISFACVAYTTVFEDVRVRFLTTLDDIFHNAAPGESSTAQSITCSNITFPSCLFYHGVMLQQEDVKPITMPTEYLANLMEFMEEAGTTPAPANNFDNSIVSRYYATLAYNLRMDKRFAWLPYFDVPAEQVSDGTENVNSGGNTTAYQMAGLTSGEQATMFPLLYGMQTEEALQTLVGAVQDSTREFSLYDLLQFLVERIEYEFLVFTSPAYHTKNLKEQDAGDQANSGRSTRVDADTAVTPAPLDKDAAKAKYELLSKKYAPDRNCDRMINFCLKPLLDDSMPPQCNIIFRSQVESIEAHSIFRGVPTRIQVTGVNDPLNKLDISRGGPGNPLLEFAKVDFYPSKYYEGNTAETADKPAHMGNELLRPIEEHTGPWVFRNNMPAWYSYALVGTKATEENKKMLRERYMRRQLIRAQLTPRVINVRCTFNPYITCGFPGVVFDSSDTGFSFAGSVISVQHNLSPNEFSTTVTMNCVRLLSEAMVQERDSLFPNPINAIHKVTHNKGMINKIYDELLGTPGCPVPGAEAVTYAEALSNWGGTIESAVSSPQNNIYEAYKLQRRNIITFEQYNSFMGLTASGDSEQCTMLTNDYYTDRAPVKVYQNVPLKEVVKPLVPLDEAKQSLTDRANELQKEIKQVMKERYEKIGDINSQIAKDNADIDRLKAIYDDPTTSDADRNKVLSQAIVKQQEITNLRSESSTITANLDKRSKAIGDEALTIIEKKKKINELMKSKSAAAKRDPFSPNGSDKSVRDVLLAVQKESFANNIY